jgi:hypothetical protein
MTLYVVFKLTSVNGVVDSLGCLVWECTSSSQHLFLRSTQPPAATYVTNQVAVVQPSTSSTMSNQSSSNTNLGQWLRHLYPHLLSLNLMTMTTQILLPPMPLTGRRSHLPLQFLSWISPIFLCLPILSVSKTWIGRLSSNASAPLRQPVCRQRQLSPFVADVKGRNCVPPSSDGFSATNHTTM